MSTSNPNIPMTLAAKPALFSRPAWIGIVFCAVVLAALPLLNLIFHVLRDGGAGA